MTMTDKCLCGSGQKYSDCCRSLVNGENTAATAEALMRSRYTAYAELNGDYLLKTWHASTCPKSLDLQQDPIIWTGLKILNTEAGQAADDNGIVEFEAYFKVNGKALKLQERSRFVKERNQWFYIDGEIKPDEEVKSKTGRNASCPCGSGKKYKYCCGRKL